MSEQEALAKIETDADLAITTSITALTDYATTLDEDSQARALQLAQLTTPAIKGAEGDGQRRRLPQINVRQPSSSSEAIPTDCKMGHFYDTNGKNFGEKVKFIPVMSHSRRVMWGDDSQIECSSLDGKTGSKYGDCNQCPYGRYEQGSKTACSKGLSYYVVTEDLEAMYRVDFMKSSSKAGRSISKLLLPPAMWARSFELSSEKQTGPQNSTYYSFKASPTGDKTPEDDMELLDKVYDVFRAQWQHAIARQNSFAARLQEENGGEGQEAITTVATEGDGEDDGVMDFSQEEGV